MDLTLAGSRFRRQVLGEGLGFRGLRVLGSGFRVLGLEYYERASAFIEMCIYHMHVYVYILHVCVVRTPCHTAFAMAHARLWRPAQTSLSSRRTLGTTSPSCSGLALRACKGDLCTQPWAVSGFLVCSTGAPSLGTPSRSVRKILSPGPTSASSLGDGTFVTGKVAVSWLRVPAGLFPSCLFFALVLHLFVGMRVHGCFVACSPVCSVGWLVGWLVCWLVGVGW